MKRKLHLILVSAAPLLLSPAAAFDDGRHAPAIEHDVDVPAHQGSPRTQPDLLREIDDLVQIEDSLQWNGRSQIPAPVSPFVTDLYHGRC